MRPDQQVAIWLHDKAAKLLLGLAGERPVSRWGVVGTIRDLPCPIGIWLDVSYVEERRLVAKDKEKRVHYGVSRGNA